MVIDVDEIRKAVAIEHDTWLGENDPALMIVTISEHILNQYVAMVAAQNAEYVKSIEASIQKGIAESKATGGRVITDASNYVSDQVKAAIASSIAEGGTKYLKAQNELLQKAEAAKKSTMIAAGVSVFCAVITAAILF